MRLEYLFFNVGITEIWTLLVHFINLSTFIVHRLTPRFGHDWYRGEVESNIYLAINSLLTTSNKGVFVVRKAYQWKWLSYAYTFNRDYGLEMEVSSVSFHFGNYYGSSTSTITTIWFRSKGGVLLWEMMVFYFCCMVTMLHLSID